MQTRSNKIISWSIKMSNMKKNRCNFYPYVAIDE